MTKSKEEKGRRSTKKLAVRTLQEKRAFKTAKKEGKRNSEIITQSR
jgi:hypothetical protein